MGKGVVPIAFVADDLLLEGHLGGLAVVEIFEGDLEREDEILALTLPRTSAAHAEQVGEQIAGAGVAGSALLQVLLAMSIVGPLLFLIAQDFVGQADLFELVNSISHE
jgi:hypothetical protein